MVSMTTTQPAGLGSFPGRSKHQTLDPRQSLKQSRVRARNETESNPDHFFCLFFKTTASQEKT